MKRFVSLICVTIFFAALSMTSGCALMRQETTTEQETTTGEKTTAFLKSATHIKQLLSAFGQPKTRLTIDKGVTEGYLWALNESCVIYVATKIKDGTILDWDMGGTTCDRFFEQKP